MAFCLSVLSGSLAQAVSAYPALHFGLYFSQFEWFNPTYLSDKANGFKTQNYVAVSTVLGPINSVGPQPLAIYHLFQCYSSSLHTSIFLLNRK